MASKKKAAGKQAKTPARAAVVEKDSRSTRQAQAKAQDEQAKKDAQDQGGQAAARAKEAKTANAAAAEKKEVDEELAAQGIAEAEAVMRQREKFNAGLRQNVQGQHTISLTAEEHEKVLAFVAEQRAEKLKKSGGGAAQKRFLVNDNPGPIRSGGVTYNIPTGRHELTPEFMKENFPGNVTVDGLAGGLLGSRIRVETEQTEGPKADGKAKSSGSSSKVQVGHGRTPANDLTTSSLNTSTHPEATSIAAADKRNFEAGNGVR